MSVGWERVRGLVKSREEEGLEDKSAEDSGKVGGVVQCRGPTIVA